MRKYLFNPCTGRQLKANIYFIVIHNFISKQGPKRGSYLKAILKKKNQLKIFCVFTRFGFSEEELNFIQHLISPGVLF